VKELWLDCLVAKDSSKVLQPLRNGESVPEDAVELEKQWPTLSSPSYPYLVHIQAGNALTQPWPGNNIGMRGRPQ
jgi:hypothetical protein